MALDERRGIWAWLNRARHIDDEIAALEAAKEEARDSVTRITQNYEADGAQTSKDPHKFDRLAELESLIDEKISEQLRAKKEILIEIDKLDNPRLKAVLIDYYVARMTFEQIAVKMNCSFRNVAYMKKRGVQALEKIAVFH